MGFFLCPRAALTKAKPAARQKQPLVAIDIETLLSAPPMRASCRLFLLRGQMILVWQYMALDLDNS